MSLDISNFSKQQDDPSALPPTAVLAGAPAIGGALIYTGSGWVAASVAYDWTVNLLPATTRYVSPTGNGDGLTPATPSSLATVNTVVNPGDTVRMEPGRYTFTTNTFFSRSGSPGAPITYKPLLGRGSVTLQWTAGATSGGLLEPSGGTPWTGAHHLVFEGLVLDGANAVGIGIVPIQGAHHVAVKFCRIRYMGATGIGFNAGDYGIAFRNEIYHCGYQQGDSSGISLWYGGLNGFVYGSGTGSSNNPAYDAYTGFHNIIVGNIISGQYDGSAFHTDGNGVIVDGSGPIPPVLIANNVVYHCGGRGIENNANSGAVWVFNNTLYQNALDTAVAGGLAADLFDNSTGGRWFNNLVYSRTSGGYVTGKPADFGAATIVAQGNNLLANGTTIAGGITPAYAGSPSFTAAPAMPSGGATGLTGAYSNAIPPWQIGNALTLTSTSVAIDAGVDPLSVIDPALRADLAYWLGLGDVLGQRRVAGRGIDIGAYEFQGNP